VSNTFDKQLVMQLINIQHENILSQLQPLLLVATSNNDGHMKDVWTKVNLKDKHPISVKKVFCV